MKFVEILLCLALVFCNGCSKPPVANKDAEPLTIDAWKTLPTAEKYEISTFERLKHGNPKLQDDGEWQRFARTVVLPAQKREQPNASK